MGDQKDYSKGQYKDTFKHAGKSAYEKLDFRASKLPQVDADKYKEMRQNEQKDITAARDNLEALRPLLAADNYNEAFARVKMKTDDLAHTMEGVATRMAALDAKAKEEADKMVTEQNNARIERAEQRSFKKLTDYVQASERAHGVENTKGEDTGHHQ